MTIQLLAGRSVALLASASTTIALLMATLVPPAHLDDAKLPVAGAAIRLALLDDEESCRFPQGGMADTFPCLPKPRRPAPPARS